MFQPFLDGCSYYEEPCHTSIFYITANTLKRKCRHCDEIFITTTTVCTNWKLSCWTFGSVEITTFLCCSNGKYRINFKHNTQRAFCLVSIVSTWSRFASYNGTAWASCQIRKIAGAHARGMPGTFSPSPQVSDPDMHHGTCVTPVPWCMPGSLTSGFLWKRQRGKTFPAFPAHAEPAILRIW